MTKYLDVSGVSYPEIKQKLKEYISSNPKFTDYNFEGSALSVLMDILAYNSHINISYSNMNFAESFLDSAIKRSSVISRAKETGYLPRSASAARASINVSFTVAGNPAQYIIPRGTKFTATVDGTSYSFVCTEDIMVYNTDNIFSKTIEIYQGKFAEFSYTVDSTNTQQKFFIPNKMADTRFVSVEVKESVSSTEYTPWSDFRNIELSDWDSTREIYFLQEDPISGFFEVYFGENVLGKQVSDGNVVKISYLFTDGPAANDARNFTLASSLPNTSGFSITTVSGAVGGDEKQSIDSIKFVAPMWYASQNRACTTSDYKALMLKNYANIRDVNVWSGKDNIPRYYGRTFIAVRPATGDNLSQSEKNSIEQDLLAKYSISGITPVIVDADYIYVSVDTIVSYDASRFTGISTTSLASSIQENIEDFFAEQVNKFATPLYFSKLVQTIDDTSNVITNSITNLKLEKKIEIIPDVPTSYEFSFNNGITPKSLRCENLIIEDYVWQLEDVPVGNPPYQTGTIKVKRTEGNQEIILTSNAGTINYITGEISLVNLNIADIANDPIFQNMIIQVSPGSIVSSTDTTKIVTDYNVYANNREQIIVLKDNGITITLIAD